MRRAARYLLVTSALLAAGGASAQGIQPGDAVRINGVAISNQRFNGYYEEYRRSKAIGGGGAAFSLELSKQLRREALDLLIEQELVRQAAVAAEIPVGDEEVEEQVAKLRAVFDNEEGFVNRLKGEGFTAETYREHTAGVIAGGRYVGQLRAAVPAVSDADLATYYRENQRRLTYPEQVRVRHILLTWKPLGTGDDRAAIREQMAPILEQARSGADFAELAKQHSEDRETVAQGGDIGFFQRGQRPPAFEDVAFALAPGEVSDMVETPFGVHILRLEERLPEELLPLEDVREKLRDHVHQERMNEAVALEIERLREAAEIDVLVPIQTTRGERRAGVPPTALPGTR